MHKLWFVLPYIKNVLLSDFEVEIHVTFMFVLCESIKAINNKKHSFCF